MHFVAFTLGLARSRLPLSQRFLARGDVPAEIDFDAFILAIKVSLIKAA
jgi:hypothetical protein